MSFTMRRASRYASDRKMRRTLLNDVVFKIVFGGAQNERLLRSLLNAVLELEGQDKILSLELLTGELSKAYATDRGAVLDVRARDGQGRQYNVEVQVRGPANYIERSLFYLSRLYSEQVERGDDYHLLRRTVAISILDFVLFPDRDQVHSRFRFMDSRQDVELSDTLEIHYLELTKFKRDQALNTPLEKWLHLLRFAELYEGDFEPLPDAIRSEEEMVMALDGMKKAYARDEVRELIEARLKAEWDEASRLGDATRKGLAEGLAQGLAEGREKGLALGLEQGLSEGRAEGLAKGLAEGKAEGLAEAARTMRSLGMDPETIFKATGIRFEA